ncbi:MAG: GLUG motif-containing protein, partial [Planctomycetota bacterium]
LLGTNEGTCRLSFWDVNSSGVKISSGGRPKTTPQMQDATTFLGWGASEYWTIEDGNDYPRFSWQDMRGEAIVELPDAYSGGTGDIDDPFHIVTAEDFIDIAYRSNDFDKHFILMQDVDLSGIDPNRMAPIGNNLFPFCGVFDGDGHTIQNSRYELSGESYVGIFGCVGPNVTEPEKPSGRVMNLNIVNAAVAGRHFVGILAGINRGAISSCSVQGICSGAGHVGGLTGANWSTIEGTHSAGVVDGDWSVGGLVGRNFAEVISCSFDGEVIGGDSIGGLAGRQNHLGAIRSSRASGRISGAGRVGGLVGDNYGSIESGYSTCTVAGRSDYIGGLAGASFSGRVAHCYSVGPVVGDNHAGGLIGACTDRAYNCYWDVEASGLPSSCTGMGRSTREMMKSETFRGWGYPGVWFIEEGLDYPRLAWELTPGRPITDPEHRYSGGTGDPDAPYEIRTTQDFVDLAYYQQDFDKHFVLTNDIDISSADQDLIVPIGTRPIPFTGVFDGNGHVVSHFSYHAGYEYSAGVFGALKQLNAVNGLLANLGIVGASISGQNMSGVLVGYNEGTVVSCYSADSSVESTSNAGGLVGYNSGSVIASWSSSAVSGRSNSGGLVGYNRGTIESCYTLAEVNGVEHVGGLVGTSSGTIVQCYSSTAVNGQADIGGLLGANVSYGHERWGEVLASFWDREKTGLYVGVGNLDPDPGGALGRATAEMHDPMTFVDVGWDFVYETANGTENIWWILEGQGYPRLWWEPFN